MTRNEAITQLKSLKEHAENMSWNDAATESLWLDDVKALQIAIKSLEAWDKLLNAKIAEMPDDIIGRYVDGFADGIESAQKLAIILLHKAESEAQDADSN